MAQAPSLSLPTLGGDTPNFGNLPLPPSLPGNSSAPLPPATPGIDFETPQDQAAIEKSIAELPTDGPQSIDLKAPETATKRPKEIVPNIAKPLPSSGTKLTGGRSKLPPPLPAPIEISRATGSPPPLSLPPLSNDAPPFPAAIGGNIGGFAEVSAPVKSWQVKLAPSYKPKKTNYNYKHVQLPDYLYRPAYDRENQHLPIRQTDASYDVHYLHAVARNDINATRAFLNSGRSVNMQNANGDNALVIALQFGAFDVARLLIERGADPFAPGALGASALDYARSLHAYSVLESISKHFGV